MSFMTELAALLDPAGILTGAQIDGYLLDNRRRYHGAALAVVRPRSTAEVSAVMQLAHAHRVPVVPQGGNTGNCGAATPDDSGTAIVLSLERMNRVLAVDADNNTITAQAGAVVADVQAAARGAGRLFAADWGAVGSARIGGALGTNAGGVNVLHYGNMRELTLGLEVVLADGTIWDGLRGLRKDNTGYDLKQLFIGSEGTLGVITAAVLKLSPQLSAQATALVALATPEAAVTLLRGLQDQVGERVTSFELISRRCWELLAEHCPELPQPFDVLPPWAVLVELSDGGEAMALTERLAEALFALGHEDVLLAQSVTEARDFWRLREHIPESQRRRGVSIKHDIAVPVSHIPAFMREAEAALAAAYPDLDLVAFGHVGDGNLHYNVFLGDLSKGVYEQEPAVNAIVYEIVARHQGTISAEHGVGQLKRDQLPLYRSEIELSLMRTIKAALDPQGIMNPGKVL
ncbi:D-2-hydroxyacid dehydrogenase [Jeongeupia sp. HS-3]|uniref:FAD-binding oxidoreductase n=1 Tax=Jeongeupia sp. HS-3 TaxID=1009682 RepID=UPI0018A513FA|nr:FAD-binding oxidoreductase [Jeongeupia sp. HS-3]BCL76736.1 D-2-hydroxyacid dehydrogenase [Jeongeupia sp. HS-3]